MASTQLEVATTRPAWGTQRRPVSAVLYPAAFAVPALAAALIGVGWWTGWGGYSFSASLVGLRMVEIGPLALALVGLSVVAERVRPAQRRPLVARGHRHDVLFLALNGAVLLPVLTALSLSFTELVDRAFPWIVLPRMGVLPRWGAVVLVLVAMDGCNWLVHLANHRVQLLWRFHELHHSEEDMNVLTVFRTHPLIHVSYLLAAVPGIVLLANGQLSTLLLVLYGGMVAFAHSNTNLGFGPLGRVFVSPNFHRVHHRLVGAQDVNLGFVLSIWDQLSRRAVFPTPEMIGADTGLPGRPLRVETEGPRPHHLAVFATQLVAPFRPLRAEQAELPSVKDTTSRGEAAR